MELYFDGTTIIRGEIIKGRLSAKVILSKRYYDSPLWTIGYEYFDWYKGDFDFKIPIDIFTLNGYLDFIEKSDLETIKVYFKLKELLIEEFGDNYKNKFDKLWKD